MSRKNRTGVFFEVGGYGAYAMYLSDPNWRYLSRDREAGGKELLVPRHYEEEYDDWEVYYIEPLAHNMEWLQKEAGRIYPQSKFVQVAVGGADTFNLIEVIDMAHVQEGRYSKDLTASIVKSNLFGDEPTESVRNSFYSHVMTLDSLFKHLDAYPTVLRIDIEGAEVEALEAYSFDPAPRIVQVDAHQINNDACCEILVANNYYIADRAWGDFNDDVYAIRIE